MQDDDFYRLFIDWLPFETSLGEMTLGEYRKENSVLRYVTHLDQFRQIARVAAAQDQCILNGAYTYNAELLDKFAEVFPDEPVEEVDPAVLTQTFEDLTLDERERCSRSSRPPTWCCSRSSAQPRSRSSCRTNCRRCTAPAPTPASCARVEQSREIADPLWSVVLDNLAGKHASEVYAQLCFNFNNPLIRKLAQL